jgi:hypothetical protein
VVRGDTSCLVFHPNSFLNFHADDAWPEEDPPRPKEAAKQGVVIELLEDEEGEDAAPRSVSSASPAASSPSPSQVEGGRGNVSSSSSSPAAADQGDAWSSYSEHDSPSAGPSSAAPTMQEDDWSLESRIMDSKHNAPSTLLAAGDADDQMEFDSFALMMGMDIDPGPSVARPKTIEEGMKDQQRKEALMREFGAHVQQRTFEIVNKTDDMQLLRMMMLQTEKRGTNGKVTRFKARMVVDGSSQERKFGKVKSFAPNITKESFRLMLTRAAYLRHLLAGWDVCEAFLNPELGEDQVYYAYPPPGFWLLCKEAGIEFKRGQVLKLKKAIYGLVNASREWNILFTDWMVREQSFVQCQHDPCVFVRAQLVVGVHTDDILATGPTEQLHSYGETLGKRFSVRGGETPGLYCGMELERDPNNGSIYVSMKGYTTQVINKFLPGEKINPSGSPSPVDQINKDDELQECDFQVRSAVGSLLYLAIVLRFDIAHATNKVARHVARPTVTVVRRIKRLLRYLQGSIDFCLVFAGDTAQPLKWVCSADGSLAPDDTRQSTGGYVVRLGDSIIAWKVVTAKCILLSTCECELFFIFQGAKAMKWLVQLAAEVLQGQVELPALIQNDNMAAIEIVNDGRTSQRTRHIEIKYLFTHQMVEQKWLKVEWIASKELHADLLTKDFHPEPFIDRLRLFERSIRTRLLRKKGR